MPIVWVRVIDFAVFLQIYVLNYATTKNILNIQGKTVTNILATTENMHIKV